VYIPECLNNLQFAPAKVICNSCLFVYPWKAFRDFYLHVFFTIYWRSNAAKRRRILDNGTPIYLPWGRSRGILRENWETGTGSTELFSQLAASLSPLLSLDRGTVTVRPTHNAQCVRGGAAMWGLLALRFCLFFGPRFLASFFAFFFAEFAHVRKSKFLVKSFLFWI